MGKVVMNQRCNATTSRYCIYCGSQGPLSKEHALSKAFGDFHGTETLPDRICKKCNESFKGLEGELLRTGYVGLCRYFVGLGYDKKKGATNIFASRSYGIDPPEMKYKPPGFPHEVLIEYLPGTRSVTIRSQIILRSSSGDCVPVPVPPDISDADEFKHYIEKIGYRDYEFVSSICLDEDIERLWHLTKAFKARVDSRQLEWEELGSEISGDGRINIGPGSFRAIAKIGFHYAIQHFANIRGDEREFEPIRDFIRHGRGNAGDFVSDREPLLQAMKHGLRPATWQHILVARQVNEKIEIHLQFYAGPDFVGPCYKVRLGKNPSSVLLPIKVIGHTFEYFSKTERKDYDGIFKRIPSGYLH